MAVARSGSAASVVAGNKIWITGGYSNENGHLTSTEIINPDGSITPGPELPEKRNVHCQLSYQNKVYIIGKLFMLRHTTSSYLTSF